MAGVSEPTVQKVLRQTVKNMKKAATESKEDFQNMPRMNQVSLLTYFTFAYLLLLWDRPPIRFLQPARSWASLSNCPQVLPIFLMSSSRSRRHEFIGLPLFLFPWVFHFRAYLVLLVAGLCSVWPIHFQRRFKIS